MLDREGTIIIIEQKLIISDDMCNIHDAVVYDEASNLEPPLDPEPNEPAQFSKKEKKAKKK